MILGWLDDGLPPTFPHDRYPARSDQREEYVTGATMRLDLLQPLHPRLNAVYVQEHVFAAELTCEPLMEEQCFILSVDATVVDKYADQGLGHLQLLVIT